MAKLRHPVPRQDALFAGRLAALVKRLDMRGNPANNTCPFPRPKHPLFPDQEAANLEIARMLGEEIDSAQYHTKETDAAAKDYHAMTEAVKKVDMLCRTASARTVELQSLVARLQNGVDSAGQDGLPPNLDTEACLEKSSHTSFLAHLPDTVERINKLEAESRGLLLEAQRALSDLRFPNISEDFVEESRDAIDELAAVCSFAVATREATLAKAEALKRVRRIWTTMADVFDRLNGLRDDIAESIKQHTWKSDLEGDAALLTPESPASVLLSTEVASPEISERLDSLASTLNEDIMSPLGMVSSSLGSSLREYLFECASGLKCALEDARRMAAIFAAVQKQYSDMINVLDETNALQLRVEELRARCESGAEDLLTGALDGDLFKIAIDSIIAEFSQLSSDAQSLQESLPRRIAFVAPSDKTSGVSFVPSHQKRFSVSSGLSLDVVRQATSVGLPIDLVALDRTVRSDSNRYSIILAGEIESLSQAINQFRLSEVARRTDLQVSSISASVGQAVEATGVVQRVVHEATDQHLSLDQLVALSDQIDEVSKVHGPVITSACVSLRDLVTQLDSGLAGLDHASGKALTAPRKRAFEEAKRQVEFWRESVEVLSERISDLRHLEQTRLIEEERAKEEEERLRLEAEQERVEAERRAAAEAEAQARAEEERLRLEQEAAQEQERLAIEAAEAERRRLTERQVISLDEGTLIYDF